LDLILALFRRALRAPQATMDAFIPFLYHPSTPRGRVQAEVAILRKWAPSRLSLWAQVLAILNWSSYARLPKITAPTLVLHGDSDRLVPMSNGELLARRIPGARFTIIPHAGHMLATDQPELTYKAVSEFLAAVEACERQTANPSPAR
jgi:pimeloyl-ACP methyl ester carboxylesterase